MGENSGDEIEGARFFSDFGYFDSAMRGAATMFSVEDEADMSIAVQGLWRGATLGIVTTLTVLKDMGLIGEDFDKAAFDASMATMASKMASANGSAQSTLTS